MTPVAAADSEELMAYASRTARQVEAVMRQDLEQALRDNDPFLPEVLEYALFSGGKRIRPLLAILSSRLCGRHDDQLYLLAAGFEYLHVATLIHDDIIDHANMRRGQKSVISKYGLAPAILAGDWLHARSMHTIGRLVGPRGLEVFCGATTAMVDGEFLQLRHCGNPAMSEKEYFGIIRRKTARLIGSTCEIGALYGGGDKKRQQALARYGDRVGTAFQVIDDLLDYLGDETRTGKLTNNDFVEGKLTLPLLKAMASANEDDRHTVANLIRGDRTTHEARTQIQGLVAKNNGFISARDHAVTLVDEAVAALQPFNNNAGNRQSYRLLTGLASYILKRQQ